MDINLNGKKRRFEQTRLSVTDLVKELDINPKIVHVQLNGAMLDRAHFDDTFINEGDEVEIITYMGGGH
ncbi:sulfur carrier protein ThiS [Natranaerobius thermophilus]|uniref:Thiamine biosynthesis protein ThiS n=1 Tax=Natranaerobius thermophilus (strain ATCC BAA-1301 / DSM 18059 / JW/NM-WN-LF) TaxID=457570 RepID=B2A156_NATTJ|nr:sulfur carrier protein ThiS [Natranaerobius thermophilus]ACB84679.1 thiamine biosynthesis protein ThiS [Natranaerobius thermophilus JW/NM-WN-LF]